MDAQISIVVTAAPITMESPTQRADCGAVLDFRGVVRSDEDGEQIAGLSYEAYQPMAERQMERIARELVREFPCRFVSVTHRIGFVPAGEASIALRVSAPHRQEAISFVSEFMNRLKQNVPIWKRTSQSNAPRS